MSDEVRVDRLIDAAPDVVFDAFTNQAGQEAFYGSDEPGWVVESECDLRVGGVWSITFGPTRSQLYRHRHLVEVVDRPRRLVLATTELRPDGSEVGFTTEFTFAERDGRTLMTMIQIGLPTAALRDEHALGVPTAMDRLERAIRERALPQHQTLRLLDGRFVLERASDTEEIGSPADVLALVYGPDGSTRMRRDDTAGDAWVALWNGDAAHDPQATGMLSAIVTPLAAGRLPVWVASSYDGDLVLVPADRLHDAVDILRDAGHHVAP